MKSIITHISYFLCMVALLTLTSCECGEKNKATIHIGSIYTCTHNSQTIDITYSINTGNGKQSPVLVNATTDCEWIDSISNIDAGVLHVTVSENKGAQRKATIELSASGVKKPQSIELIQLASPNAADSSHTLIFYFFGTSLGSYFDTNLNDASLAISENILGHNRVVYILQSNATKCFIGELSYDASTKMCVDTVKDIVYLNSNGITSEDIAETLSLAASHAPADRYGVVLAGHGQGWVTCEALNNNSSSFSVGTYHNIWSPAIGAESTRAFGERNTQVDISDLAAGIEKSTLNIDYLLFDACFMSNIESLYTLRNSANYIIASPCEIMGRGFPYHRTLPYLFANDGAESDLIGAAESYYLYYRDEYTGSARCGSVAVIDCSELEHLATTTRELYKSARESYDKSALQTYEGQHEHLFYDFGQWCEMVATDTSALESFKAQFDKAVIARFTLPTFYSAFGSYGTYPINEEVYTGVTTSAPSSLYPDAWIETDWYKSITE